jgi:phage/plasmid primase-like uncharacterized protein
VIEPGRLHRFATSDRRGDTAGWCCLFDDLRAGSYGCMRAGIKRAWRPEDRQAKTAIERVALSRVLMATKLQRQHLQRRRWTENAQRIAALWSQCVQPVPGDPLTLYLNNRGLNGAWPLPAMLRIHPALPYWHDGAKLGSFAAMVAPVMSPDGRMVALHRTYLTEDGRKAGVPNPKKLTATAGSLEGACIPLRGPHLGCLGIAEGIETALAAHCASAVPTLAAYCAGNLAVWQWPASLQRLVIFADADETGRDAADTLRSRALAAGLRVELLTPTEPGADWCDVWSQRHAVQIEAGSAL